MSNNISVVIPVYNGEAFIARAIQSVLNQSIKPFEVIVVNDGSKDGTAEQLLAFEDKIRVISIQNGGVSNARNLGVKASTGDFIAFLDADDVWYEDKLKLQLEVFERYPNVGFSCCDYEFYDSALGLMTNHFQKFKHDSDIVFDMPISLPLIPLVKVNFVGTCSNVMIRKQVLDRVGLFNVSYKQSEDYDLWLRCSLVTQFLLMSNAMVEKKSHDTNLTNNFLETLLFHEKVLVNLPLNNEAQDLLVKIKTEYLSSLALIRYEIGNLFYEKNEQIQAFNYFFLGLRTVLTINNIKLFGHFFIRKLFRTISFGLIKNKRPS